MSDEFEALTGEASRESSEDETQEQTQAFLDALTLRSSGEFDVDLAQSMQNVLGEAIRMVESQSADIDKAIPGATGAFPQYPGATARRFEHSGQVGDLATFHYTMFDFGQPLSEVYQWPVFPQQQGEGVYHVVTQNYDSLIEDTFQSEQRASERELSATRVLLAGGIPVATTVAGAMLLVASATTTPIIPNPYVALMILIAGIGLLVTATVALRERRQRDD